MHSDPQWSGNSQKEMADSLQYLVEEFPQIPVGKMVRSTVAGIRSVVLAVKDATQANENKTHVTTEHQCVTDKS